ATKDVLALTVEIPREVDARHRERAAVVEDARRCAPARHVADAVEDLVRRRIEELRLRRIVLRRVEVTAESVEFLVVRPVAEPRAVFQRQVWLQLPGVLGEAVHVPEAE